MQLERQCLAAEKFEDDLVELGWAYALLPVLSSVCHAEMTQTAVLASRHEASLPGHWTLIGFAQFCCLLLASLRRQSMIKSSVS